MATQQPPRPPAAAPAARSSPASQPPYVGSRISLISKSAIRYVGTLYTIDTNASTVALKDVRSYGTEGRPREGGPVQPSTHVFSYIVFHGPDIRDLHFLDTPAATSTTPPPTTTPALANTAAATAAAVAVAAPPVQLQLHQQQQHQRHHLKQPLSKPLNKPLHNPPLHPSPPLLQQQQQPPQHQQRRQNVAATTTEYKRPPPAVRGPTPRAWGPPPTVRAAHPSPAPAAPPPSSAPRASKGVSTALQPSLPPPPPQQQPQQRASTGVAHVSPKHTMGASIANGDNSDINKLMDAHPHRRSQQNAPDHVQRGPRPNVPRENGGAVNHRHPASRRGRGRRRSSRTATPLHIPEEDFDFETNNERFERPESTPIAPLYDRNKSFFDELVPEKDMRGERNAAQRRQTDLETFGDAAITCGRRGHRGRGRGRRGRFRGRGRADR
ncbi:Protein LSM14-like [Gracilariopsis chorda]|uniref:Protein LSM14-like n=1 Tax=Gracilariopsis chorda TaxID=448386 RepID=A0A2V3IEU2_9FLOR|nr:Protein LSM14-like [Gracilariopsis chorda]|eukprot:PXF40572.1 Protein LSM14-like [Gracilariopsis chorda]